MRALGQNRPCKAWRPAASDRKRTQQPQPKRWLGLANLLSVARMQLILALAPIIGFVGVLVGVWFSARNERVRRQMEFVTRQLHELYSPLLGIRTEILALSELRLRLEHAANAAWRKLCDEASMRGGAEELKRLTETRSPEISKDIDYINQQFETKLLPAYERMLSLMRDNFFLAEESTRSHFPKLVEYVELCAAFLTRQLCEKSAQQ